MADYTTKYLFEIDVVEHGIASKAQEIARKLEAALGQNITVGKGLVTAQADLAKATELANTKITEQTALLGHYKDQAAATTKSVQSLSKAQVSSTTKIASTLTQSQPVVKSWFATFNEGLNKASLQWFGLRRLGYSLDAIGQTLTRSGKAIFGFMTQAGESYLTFNEAATRAAMAMEMQIELQDILEEKILDTAQALGLFSPEELAEGLRLWAAGTGEVIKTEEELNEILAQTVDMQKLAAMNVEELAGVTQIVGGIMHGFGMTLEDVTEISEILNYVAGKTFVSVADIGQAASFAAPMAHQLGISLEELTATVGILSDANLKGTRVGRALNQMFIRLLNPTKDHDDAMNNLIGTSGELGDTWRNIYFPEGEFVSLADYVDRLSADTEHLTKMQRAELVATIATANVVPILLTLLDKQSEARKENVNRIEAEVAALADSKSFWEKMWSDWEASDANRAKRMRARWDAALKGVGKSAIEAGLPVMEWAVDAISKLVKLTEQYPWLIIGLGVGATASVLIGGMLTVLAQLALAVANFSIMQSAATLAGAAGTAAGAAGVAGGTGVAVGATGGSLLAKIFGATGLTVGGLAGAAYIVVRELMRNPELKLDQVLAADKGVQERFDEMFYHQIGGESFTARDTAALDFIEKVLGERLRTIFALDKEGREQLAQILDAISKQLGSIGATRGSTGWMEERMQAEAASQVGAYDLYPSGEVSPILRDQQAINDQIVALQREYEETLLQLRLESDEKFAKAHTDWLDWQSNESETHLQKEASIEQKYAADKIKRLADYIISEQRAKEEFAFSEARILEDFRHQEQKAEESYLRQLEQDARQHAESLADLVTNAREADEKALKAYHQDIFQLEEDYQQELLQMSEDYQEAIQEAAKEHAERLAELTEQYHEDMLDDAEQHAERLADLETSYHEAIEDAAEQHAERLAKIAKNLQDTLEDDAERHAERLANLETSYYEAVEEAAQQHADRLVDLRESYEEGILDDAKKHADRLEDIEKDYNKAVERDAEQHTKRIADLTENYRKTEERNAEDHLRRMERMEQDHLTRLDDLIRTRDARGLLREMRDYARDRDEAVEDYETDKERREKDYEDKVKDENERSAKDKERRLRDYEDRLNEEKERYAEQKKKRREDYEERIKEEHERFEEQAKKRREEYGKQVREERERAEQQKKDRQEAYEERLREEKEQLEKEALQREEDYQDQIAKEHERLEEQKKDRQEAYEEQVAEEKARHAERVADEETRYAEQREKRLKDYELQRQELTENYVAARAARREAYAQQVAEEREQFAQQKVLRQQEYALAREEATENFARAAARRTEDYTRTRQQAAEAFARREEDATIQFEAAMEAEDLRYEQAHDKRKLQYEKQLALLIEELEDEEQALRDAHLDKLRKLAGYGNEIEEFYRDHYNKLLQDAKDFLADYQYIWDELQDLVDTLPELPDRPRLGGDEPGWRQQGGYAIMGKYWLGEAGKEFVLSAPTVRSLESRYGALNQSMFRRMDYINSRDDDINMPPDTYRERPQRWSITPQEQLKKWAGVSDYRPPRWNPLQLMGSRTFGGASMVQMRMTQHNVWTLPTGTTRETLEQVREIAYAASYEAITDASQRALVKLQR